MPPILAIEVIATADAGGPPLDQRFEVKTTFCVGRGPTNDLPLNDANLSRLHCRFTVKGQTLFVEDLSENGISLNGKSQHGKASALVPGDCIGLPGGLVMRVCGAQKLTLEPNDPLLKAVEEAPHDDGRWRVWADQLLEAGSPLGARIAVGHGADATQDAHVLTTLNDELASGNLALHWRHGFMQRAVVRNMSLWQATSWDRLLRRLVAHPLAHFLQELEIDALSFGRGVDRSGLQQVEALIIESLEWMAKSAKLSLLERLRFGPSPQPLWSPRLATAWSRCTDAFPKLSPQSGPIWVARAAWLQLLSTPAGVSVTELDVGAQRALKEEQANLVGRTPEVAFSLLSPEESPSSQVGVRIDREHGLWWVTDIVAEARGLWHRAQDGLKVNGRECIRHRLRPGDVLEVAPGLTFKLVME